MENKFSWNEFFIRITSRKFLMALIGVISSILVLFNIDAMTREQIIAILGEVVVVIGYITGESIIDAKRVSALENFIIDEDDVEQM